MKKLILICVTLSALSACNKETPAQGNEGASGGDHIAQTAQQLANEVLIHVESTPGAFADVPVEKLRGAIRNVKIIVRDHTYANGTETDASNNGKDTIELSRSRWVEQKNKEFQQALIFHELLGLIGVEENSYAISYRLLSVETRFAPAQTYTCQQRARTGYPCELSLRFDHTRKAFVVTQLANACSGFYISEEVFYPVNQSEYSFNVRCADPANQNEFPCYFKNQDDLKNWMVLIFHDGFSFHFEGKQNYYQLTCAPNK